MPGAFGPILTTGVALSAAVVVVTNPVTAPPTDVRIPAAQSQVSKAGQAVDMLDEDFIQAVGPGPTGSTNPFAVLKDLVSSLVADAADLGKDAILRAFVAGTSVVSGQQVPELTAASYPYIPPVYIPPVAPDRLPWPALPGPVPTDLRPVVEQALTAIITDSGDFTDSGVVAAAFVAGAALAAEVSPILESLRGLVDAQLRPALNQAGSALAALSPPLIGDVIRDVVDRYLPTAPSVADVQVLPRRDANPETDPLLTGEPSADDDASLTSVRQARPNPAKRTPDLMADVVAAEAPGAETVVPKHPFSGLARLGAAAIGGPHRPAAPNVGDGGRSPIAGAVKAAIDRARD